jgi:hypothetical protein
MVFLSTQLLFRVHILYVWSYHILGDFKFLQFFFLLFFFDFWNKANDEVVLFL